MLKKSETKGWSKEALAFLGKAVKGDYQAQYELGLRLIKGEGVPRNHTLAVDWLIKSSNQGFEDAQFLLGTCYATGIGVEENDRVALGFFMKAANAANKYAQFELAEHYFAQDNFTLATEWYTKAARQQFPPAQFELGRCLYYGYGMSKSETKGLEWLEKAAEKNHKPAIQLLQKIEDSRF